MRVETVLLVGTDFFLMKIDLLWFFYTLDYRNSFYLYYDVDIDDRK